MFLERCRQPDGQRKAGVDSSTVETSRRAARLRLPSGRGPLQVPRSLITYPHRPIVAISSGNPSVLRRSEVNAKKLSAIALSDLSRRASFVFRGRVKAVGKHNLHGVEPDDRMSMVRIDEVIVAPASLGDLTGKTVTVYLESSRGVKANDQAIFFATSWHYGRTSGVTEIGRTSMSADELRRRVIDERLEWQHEQLEARIRRAVLIISGKVLST